ncbi:MAG: phenylalanine--tRNA ligase subunit beta [Candidatus Anammoximicrobium sp.]|nr:phenylalanine--tRNA ligase subunit beta [Candidatus Anammoximicrobium sp.]
MLVSWKWLQDYVSLPMSPDELVERLSMAGLNYEDRKAVGDDLQVDLEVTSNRPDCLGHIGVAREVSVLWQTELRSPPPQPAEAGPPVTELTKVAIECPHLCFRYTARVLQGVRIGPSPHWLADRLATIGIPAINNVVDVTNYVMMECGQPLHAFDFAKLAGPQIIVREARPGELFEAINHKTYPLEPGMCVIADAQRAVALGGVMGGADTEVSDATADVLIEAADFAPLSIRTTARKLTLHSPSSYRFERSVDPVGVDWASRRCCELILQLGGGRLAQGVIAVGQGTPIREPIVLRLSQLPRVLGIEIPAEEVQRILTALGCQPAAQDTRSVTVVPPSWRRDLTREIDLVEEVARVYGYERIPEDVGVPMAPSHRSHEDRVLGKVRQVLLCAGFDEAITASVVPEELAAVFSPWTEAPPLQTSTPMLKGADRLRQSLIPSLLEARRVNESLGNPVIELFETARVFLPVQGDLPGEQGTLGIVSGGDYYHVKGVIEAVLAALRPGTPLEALDTRQPLLDAVKSSELRVQGRPLGYLGELSAAGLQQAGLRSSATVAELSLPVLVDLANLIPKYAEQSPYPAIERDLNLIVDESVRWASLAETVGQSVGECLERVRYQEIYRDPKKDGAGKKRLLFSITLRSRQRTLTNEEADQIRQQVVAACHQAHGAVLLGA